MLTQPAPQYEYQVSRARLTDTEVKAFLEAFENGMAVRRDNSPGRCVRLSRAGQVSGAHH
jgi:hypothetical protein